MKRIKKKYIIILICLLNSLVFLGQPETNKCLNCHKDIMKFEFAHPVAEDDCQTCHESNNRAHPGVSGNEFKLTVDGPDLCYVCHEAKNTKTNVHSPITDGYCWMCHSPHSSPNKALITEKPTEKLCVMCHDLEIPESEKLHTPVKKGDCQSCHDSHQSDNPSFLKQTKPQVCFSCHNKVEEESNYDNIHYPFDDDCSTCHQPHSSPQSNLMTEQTPGLCFNCHDDLTEAVKNSASSHSILFDEKNCANCHSPHASEYSMMLYKEGQELCLTCHNKTINTDNKTIGNISYLIKRGKSVHAAVEMDGCATCHKSHFSENAFLLTGNYPSSRYSEASVQNFGLCFDCHDTGLLEKEITDDATNFRTGDKNMHFIHINGKKGRTCSLCHDMHGSKNEHLILREKEFGNWTMNMNYKVTNEGGSCFPGCHAEKSYLR